MKIIGIIPSRYASTRFPGKPLIDIAGKSMIQRVYEQSKKCLQLSKVIVATDDERILDHVKSFGGEVMITSSNHTNGTERCAEVAITERADYYINIQGDEPFIKPGQISDLCNILDNETELGSLVKKITDVSLLHNPNTMKVIINQNHEAIYFSRTCVPYLRDFPMDLWLEHHTFYKHVCIYAYRADILQKIVKLPPGKLEKAESLEQLRWIEHGYKIKIATTDLDNVGIDVPDDVHRALKLEGLS